MILFRRASKNRLLFLVSKPGFLHLFIQSALVTKLEREISVSKGESVEDEVSGSNVAKRKELTDHIRKNGLILKQMKTDLKYFIDETAKLDPDFNENDGSSIGYLLQVWI